MALAPYTVTALAESDAEGTGGKNIVAGALITLEDVNGNTATIYDDSAGTNPSTAKTTNSNGQKVIYAEAGEYSLTVNGGPATKIIVGADKGTTAFLISSTRNYREGDTVETTGYASAGDGGAAMWRKTADTDTASQSPGQRGDGTLTDATGAVWELVGVVVRPLALGADAGNPSADNTEVIKACIASADSGFTCLDLLGLEYYCSGYILSSISSNLTIKNGSLIANGSSDRDVFMRVITTANMECENLIVDSQNLCSKGLLITPDDPDCEITMIDCQSRNCIQTNTATVVAAALQITPDYSPNDSFKKCVTQEGVYENVTSTKTFTGTLTSVGRGVLVQDCEDLKSSGLEIKNIGPHYDGDGFVVSAQSDIAGRRANYRCVLTESTFADCQKRAVKSQVAKTIVSDIEVKRTQAFPSQDTQTEVGLLEGGILKNMSCQYATGSEPGNIVEFIVSTPDGFATVPCSASSLEISSEDPSGVIRNIASFAQNEQGVTLTNCSLYDVNVSCKVRNIVRAYSDDEADNGPDFDPLTIRDVTIGGWSGETEQAVVFMNRRSASYNYVRLFASDIYAVDGTQTPMFYRNTDPGSTAFFTTEVPYASNVSVTDDRVIDVYYGGARTFTYSVNEDGTLSKGFFLSSSFSSVQVSVSYTSSRDAEMNKLFMAGVVQASSAKAYYLETVSGRKSSTQTGAIDIIPSNGAQAFTVTKSAGSTGSTGYLTVTIVDTGGTVEA